MPKIFLQEELNNQIDISVRKHRKVMNVETASRIPFGTNVLVEKEEDND